MLSLDQLVQVGNEQCPRNSGKFNLCELIKNAHQIVCYLAQVHITLDFDDTTKLLESMIGDEDLYFSILVNLLSSAAKFSAVGQHVLVSLKVKER